MVYMPATLKDLKRGLLAKGIVPNQTVTVIDVQWHGANAITVTYRREDGSTNAQLIYRERLPTLEIVSGSLRGD